MKSACLRQISIFMTAMLLQGGCMDFNDGTPSAPLNIYSGATYTIDAIPATVKLNVGESVFCADDNIRIAFTRVLQTASDGNIAVELQVVCPEYTKLIGLDVQGRYHMENGQLISISVKEAERINGSVQIVVLIDEFFYL